MCVYGDKCRSRHVEYCVQLNKRSKKGGAKTTVALLKESTQLGCVSQESYPRKSILRDSGKLGSKHTVNFSRGTWHQIKIREWKGPSQGVMQKCEFQERTLVRRNSKIGHRKKLCNKNDAPRREAWDLSKNVYKLKNKNKDKATFYSLHRSMGNAGTLFEKARVARTRGQFRSTM